MSRFRLRLKICLNDRTAGICYIISAIVIIALLMSLDSSSEERSSIPIGVVVNDESDDARAFVNRIKETPSVYVNEGDLDSLNDMLLNGYINCIFIIEEDFSAKLKAGISDELISVISGEDDRMSVILGDIIGGKIIYEICINKGYLAYKALGEKSSKTLREYADYVENLKDDPSFAFSFDLKYEDVTAKKIEEKEITNGMIYKQMIVGMLAMMLCLIAFVSCNCFCLEHEAGISSRLKELPGKRLPLEVMDFFGIFVYTLPLSVAAGFLLSDIKGVLYSIIYLVFMCALCTLISKSVKKTETYQIAGAVIVIGLGVLGFISVFSGLIGGPEFLKYTPNAIYISLLV